MTPKDRKVTIDAVGLHGDGVANSETGRVFVPGALPGETWLVGDGTSECVVSSPDRQVPICPHFEACGGCMAQHMPGSVYRDWKTARLVSAFAHQDLNVEIAPMRSVGLHARRRTTFAFQATGPGLVFGYHRANSHEIVDVSTCPVLMPQITDRLSTLRACAQILAVPGQVGRLSATVVEGGLYVAVSQDGLALSKHHRQQLSSHAQTADLVQLTVNDDIVATLRDAVVTLSDARVVLTQPTFLQAAPAAEQMIAGCIQEHTSKARRTADLFSGIGTFTFLLAKNSRVSAFDSDAAAIKSLRAGARNNQGLKPIDATQRDLFREPLSRRELKDFDAVLINPPRAGAEAQCQRLAQSDIPTLVMVACDAVTLARDAKTLVNGGYKLTTVVPIDQFVFSEHLEAVAIFKTPKRRR